MRYAVALGVVVSMSDDEADEGRQLELLKP